MKFLLWYLWVASFGFVLFATLAAKESKIFMACFLGIAAVCATLASYVGVLAFR